LFRISNKWNAGSSAREKEVFVETFQQMGGGKGEMEVKNLEFGT
jgi:hypothetical protein